MPVYKWQGNGVFHDHCNGREVAPGETAELPEHVGEPQPELAEVDGDDELPDAPFDPGEFSVSDLREKVRDGEYTDAERAALVDAEANGQDRATAKDALGT
jgi:hypothetical protein